MCVYVTIHDATRTILLRVCSAPGRRAHEKECRICFNLFGRFRGESLREHRAHQECRLIRCWRIIFDIRFEQKTCLIIQVFVGLNDEKDRTPVVLTSWFRIALQYDEPRVNEFNSGTIILHSVHVDRHDFISEIRTMHLQCTYDDFFSALIIATVIITVRRCVTHTVITSNTPRRLSIPVNTLFCDT